MITIALILVILLSLFGIVFCCIKIVDWWDARKKPKNNKAEFSSDLYKLSQKWSLRGEPDFAKGCILMIDSFNLPDIKIVETTAYAKNLKKEIFDANTEEEEIIG